MKKTFLRLIYIFLAILILYISSTKLDLLKINEENILILLGLILAFYLFKKFNIYEKIKSFKTKKNDKKVLTEIAIKKNSKKKSMNLKKETKKIVKVAKAKNIIKKKATESKVTKNKKNENKIVKSKKKILKKKA